MAHLSEGQPIVLDHAGHAVLVCLVEGQYFAMDGRCSHAQQRLDRGRVEGFEIRCPAHGARFDLRTGRCTAAPASQPLTRFPVLLEGGKVWVEV